ncbi:aminotransferase class IV [Aurantimonas sp. Leaf443]|uniref:aminotransferase class IV n=1 Tax=Aurantimonas sp. Leaf443 TaxID=1736378 RepID=UPI0006FADFA5|nr:aminotransferase class IV [Aurantimonas sp. Leaf443]KQT83067.1 class IV aminotransferase [Aurantimonas sp. Leaf443]
MAEIWIDGAFRDGAGAIDASDRGLLLGDGVFDTALVLGSRVFRRRAHLDRLEAALAALSIPVPLETLEGAMTALAERVGEGSIRLTVTRGRAARGLALPADPRPTILGSQAPLAPGAFFAPLRLSLAEARRNETSPLSRLKTLSYLDAILANDAARRAGAQEALFLNTQGRLACSALANVFVETPQGLATPPLAEGALPGIMRALVRDIAPRLGLRVEERPVALAEALEAPLFLTNSLRLLAPAALDAAPNEPSSAMRALTQALCEAARAECGVDPREKRGRPQPTV